MTKVVAILLAAGLSERMGGPNKLLLEKGDFKLIELTYGNLVPSKIHQMVVVTGRDSEEVTSLFPEDQEMAFNPDYQLGMTSSIQTGVKWFEEDFAYMICLGDMPWLKTRHYDAVLAKAQEAWKQDPKAIVMPRVNGKPGNPVIFANHHRKAILEHNEPNGCKGIVKQNQDHLVFLDTEDKAYLMDIDTPEDFDRLNK